MGIAEALEHLHDATTESIIHRDVKSSNILLSSDNEPKVQIVLSQKWYLKCALVIRFCILVPKMYCVVQLSDFGLAVLSSNSSYHIDNNNVAGTFG